MFEKYMKFFAAVCITVLASFALIAFGGTIFSSDKTAFCYIQKYDSENKYSLKSYVYFGHNRTIGVFESFEKALEVAKAVKCPLDTE